MGNLNSPSAYAGTQPWPGIACKGSSPTGSCSGYRFRKSKNLSCPPVTKSYYNVNYKQMTYYIGYGTVNLFLSQSCHKLGRWNTDAGGGRGILIAEPPGHLPSSRPVDAGPGSKRWRIRIRRSLPPAQPKCR